MEQNDFKMISGTEKSFATAKDAIGEIKSAFDAIYQLAESIGTRILAEDASSEILLAENHLLSAENIINGKAEEPTMTDKFLKVMEAINDLEVLVSDEYVSTEDASMLSELGQVKTLISDASDILERAQLRAEGHLKDRKTMRVVLDTMGEYFTVDPTTTELRYTEIPAEYRK